MSPRKRGAAFTCCPFVFDTTLTTGRRSNLTMAYYSVIHITTQVGGGFELEHYSLDEEGNPDVETRWGCSASTLEECLKPVFLGKAVPHGRKSYRFPWRTDIYLDGELI